MRRFRIYLDNCCFNRLFDHQNSIAISLETQAKLYIQHLVMKNEIDLVWLYMLDYENSKNVAVQKKNAIALWKTLSVLSVVANSEIIDTAREITQTGIKPFDALHIASAIFAKCDYFITVDKRILRHSNENIAICNPIDFLRELEDG